MKTYTFDVKLFAAVDVRAENEADARQALRLLLDTVETTFTDQQGDSVPHTLTCDDNEDQNAELIEEHEEEEE